MLSEIKRCEVAKIAIVIKMKAHSRFYFQYREYSFVTKNKMNALITDLVALVFPNYCILCSQAIPNAGHKICLKCQFGLPITNYHLQKDNPLEKLFWGKVKIHRAASFLQFSKGSTHQKSIHKLKYLKQKQVGEIYGTLYANQLKQSEILDDIDVIIPVPLSRKRQKQRGYNQSEIFGRSIAERLNIDLNTSCLIKPKETKTQTRKSKFERWNNVKDAYQLTDTQELKGKHLAIVDDVVTTGATLEACSHELQKIEGVKISILTIACAN